MKGLFSGPPEVGSHRLRTTVLVHLLNQLTTKVLWVLVCRYILIDKAIFLPRVSGHALSSSIASSANHICKEYYDQFYQFSSTARGLDGTASSANLGPTPWCQGSTNSLRLYYMGFTEASTRKPYLIKMKKTSCSGRVWTAPTFREIKIEVLHCWPG